MGKDNLFKKLQYLICILCIGMSSCDFKMNDNSTSAKSGYHSMQAYHHLEGVLGTRTFSMELNFVDTDVFGTMYFHDVEELRDVFGTYAKNDSLNLEESIFSDYSSNKKENRFNKFEGIYTNGIYKGSFIENATRTAFKCSIVNNQQIPFDFVKYADTLKDSSSKKPILYHNIEIPFVKKQKDEFLNTFLANLAGKFDFDGNNYQLSKLLRSLDSLSFTREEIDQMKEHPYNLGHYFDVSYNDNDLIIFSYCGLKFYGNIHESFTSKYSTVYLKTKKEMLLHDVLTHDETKKLPILLEKKFREKYKLTEKDKLSKILFFDENKFVNNNYYITTQGIGFQYDPHELAGFTKGLITLYVPFSEIRNK